MKKGFKARRSGGGSDLVPQTKMVDRKSIGVNVGTGVPATYMNTRPAPSRKDGVVIRGCEGISAACTVLETQIFSANPRAVNPTNANLFPWLSDQAELWTKFFFRSLKIHFVTNQSTSSKWTVYELYSPDVEVDSGYAALTDVLQMAQKQMSAAWQSHTFVINLLEEGAEPYYIDADGADDRLENQGIIVYGVELDLAPADDTVVASGQYFVEYEVELFDRKTMDVSVLGKKLWKTLRSRHFPEELRARAGQALVAEILKSRPSKKAKDKAAEMLNEAEKLLGGVSVKKKLVELPSRRLPGAA
jgi:hypothetical protein